MSVVSITNATQLRSVLRTVRGGETLLLAPGDYGAVSLSSLNPASTVTIRSADPDNDARLFSLSVTRSSNFSFVDIDVARTLQAGERPGTVPAVAINGSRLISLRDVDIMGSLDNNASNDGLGLVVRSSNKVSILDSSFQQLRTAVVINTARDVIVSGNTITETREGVNIADLRGGIFERNLVRDMQPNYAWGDHPDAFQVHSSGGVGSADLIFRDNVILEGTSPGAIGGIFVGNESWRAGVLHDDILISNNFYQGTFRHGISVSSATDVVIDNNTVIDSNRTGISAGINILRVTNAQVTDNAASIFTVSDSRQVTSSNNIDVWDARTNIGVARASLFDTDVAAGLARTDSRLDALAGGVAGQNGVGYRALASFGSLGADAEAMADAYMQMLRSGPIGWDLV